MSNTSAEAAVMAQVASRFDNAHQSLGSTLSSLLREVESVRADWQGRGGTSFQEVSLAWGRDQEKLLRALSETAGAIRTAGRVYTATDDAAASRMQAHNIVLPL